MKKLVLLLSFMFVGVTGQISTANAESYSVNDDCVNCWAVADAVSILNGKVGDYNFWLQQLRICESANAGNLCYGQLDNADLGGTGTVKKDLNSNP